MASGKKGKKNKGKTLALTDFLQETSGTIATVPIRKSTSNWADEVEDSYDGYETSRYKLSNVVLPTAPKASRDYDDIDTKVPKEPPYMAYLSNLPYDVDEDEIADFFRNLKIANMKIPKDDRSSDAPKLKGFGYVEFEDRESLLAALSIPDTMLKSRRIRIEVATNADNDRRRGGRMDMGRDRQERPEVTSGDWRAGPRTDTSTMNDDRRGFSRGEITRDRDSGFSRSDRDGGGSGFTRDRDSGFNRDRDGGFSRDRDFNRDREGGFRDRDSGYRSRDEGFSRDRDEEKGGNWRDERNNRNMDRGFTRRNYDNDRDRGDTRDRGRFDDRDDRDRRGGGGGGGFRRYDNDKDRDRDRDDRNGSREKEDDKEKSEPRQRPKLNLAPRTKPVEPSATETVPSSIFGNAKPVDTTQREREIEEKLAKELEKPRDSSKDRKSGDETDKSDQGSRRAKSPDSHRSDHSEDPESDKRQTSRNDRSGERKITRNNDAAPAKSEKPIRREERREREDRRERDRDRHEKELPKMKEPEPPNFAASNKFAFLETEDAD